MPASSSDGRLAALNELVGGRLPELADHLDLGLRSAGRYLTGPCPVHCGDNHTAFKLYLANHTAARWQCSTRHCESKYIGDVVGLVRGVLSGRAGKDVGLKQARDWLCQWCGVDYRDLQKNVELAEKRKFVQQVQLMAAGADGPTRGWTRDEVRGRLKRPSSYFPNLGFDPDLLDRFDAGDSQTPPGHPMHGRACLPVYDPSGIWCLGATARWPSKEVPQGVKKWLHSPGLATGRLLYGLWLAAPAIRRTGRVVLVEGPVDVLGCWRAGVQEAVALFGVSLSDCQSVLLQRLSVMDVLMGFDPDKGGATAVAGVTRQLGRLCRVRDLKLRADPSDLPPAELAAACRP